MELMTQNLIHSKQLGKRAVLMDRFFNLKYLTKQRQTLILSKQLKLKLYGDKQFRRSTCTV